MDTQERNSEARNEQPHSPRRARTRRTPRSQQACANCRKKKAKCDGERPICSRCKDYDVRCLYDKVHPQRRSTQANDTGDAGDRERVDACTRSISSLGDQFRLMFEMLLGMNDQPRSLTSVPNLRRRNSAPSRTQDIPIRFQAHPQVLTQSMNADVGQRHYADIAVAPALCAKSGCSRFSMPFTTSAAACKIVSFWPFIQEFYKGCYQGDSVMNVERRHAPVRFLQIKLPEWDSRQNNVVLESAGHRHVRSSLARVIPRGFVSTSVGTQHSGKTLAFAARTPNELFESYLTHVHVLHPFLDIGRAREIIQAMERSDSPSSASSMSSGFSDLLNGVSGNRNKPVAVRENRWVRPLDEAFILFVFALGTLTESDRLDPNPERPLSLESYARAVAVITSNPGSSGLEFVHVCLLAGLYTGQLVRPLESWQWINGASVALEVMLKQDPSALDASRSGHDLDAIRLTFWTCFQLESDIVSQLDVPQSNLSRYTHDMPLPEFYPMNYDPAQNFEDSETTMMYYHEQIKLRRLLNCIHCSLYMTHDLISNDLRVVETNQRAFLRANLNCWRESLPRSLSWQDDDAPAAHINAARLRAKYYEACHLLDRPSLYYAVLGVSTDANAMIIEDPTNCFDAFHSPFGRIGVSSLQREAQRIARSLNAEPQAMLDALECLEAAIKGIEAFDGVAGMPVSLALPDLFGIMQMQFGNILILTSTFRTAHLSQLIHLPRLLFLLDRTMMFLSSIAHLSPTAQTNLAILQEIKTGLAL